MGLLEVHGAVFYWPAREGAVVAPCRATARRWDRVGWGRADWVQEVLAAVVAAESKLPSWNQVHNKGEGKHRIRLLISATANE